MLQVAIFSGIEYIIRYVAVNFCFSFVFGYGNVS